MTDMAANTLSRAPCKSVKDTRTARRYAAERRFRYFGLAAIGVALMALVLLLTSVVSTGLGAFWRTEVVLPIDLAVETLKIESAEDFEGLQKANFGDILKKSIRALFPEVKKRKARKALAAMVSPGATFLLRDRVLADPSLIGGVREIRLPLADDLNMLAKEPDRPGCAHRPAPGERPANRMVRRACRRWPDLDRV